MHRMPASRAGAFERRTVRTLVLNAGYEPLAVVSFKRALVLVLGGKATIVARDDDHPVLSASGAWDRPSVILLTRYVRIPHSRLTCVPSSPRQRVYTRESTLTNQHRRVNTMH